GTFYAWMEVAKGYSSEEFADLLLNEAGVAVAPGNGFGEYGEGYVRIGLLIEPERLEEAVDRIAKLNLCKDLAIVAGQRCFVAMFLNIHGYVVNQISRKEC